MWVTLAVTIFVPFPVYSVCIFFLAKVVRLKQNSRRRHSLQHGTGQILNRQATSQMSVNRLFISMIASMLLLCGPKLILKFLINMLEKDRLGRGIVSKSFYFIYTLQYLSFCFAITVRIFDQLLFLLEAQMSKACRNKIQCPRIIDWFYVFIQFTSTYVSYIF